MPVSDFRSIYAHGFARIAAATIPVATAEPQVNAATIVERLRSFAAQGVAVAVFPELSVTGYAIDDLLLQDVLLDDAEVALRAIAEATRELPTLALVGAPIRHGNRLYNCAVAIQRGRVIGVVPKTALPNYREFYEKRHFAEGAHHQRTPLHRPDWPGADDRGDVPFGTDLVFVANDLPNLRVHAEICEDMWVPISPSARAALGGATVLVNLSASPITVARADDRRALARASSITNAAVYAYAAASFGESTTDLSWDGMTMVYELGTLLGESERFPAGPAQTIVDVDLDRVASERVRQGSFDDTRIAYDVDAPRIIGFTLDVQDGDLGLTRPLDRFPFVPDDEARLAQDCYEAYSIQVSGLERRIRSMTTATFQPKIVIGVSGGLDSTHALIVAASAMDRLGRPRSDILGFTLPGFATSDGTKSNAIALMDALGITWEEIDIRPLATQLLRDLGHPAADGEPQHDVTFENVQAGVRTDLLFRIAGQRGGFVLGTGDLSELALGWCTYGVGDQMSHYGVNAGVPKTLMQHLIRWVIASDRFDPAVGDVLAEIVGQEISPELVPVKPGERMQSTEDAIGPYALQDFTLYHVLRHGTRPSTIVFLAEHAWSDASAGGWPKDYPEDRRIAYDRATIVAWMRVFLQRFFSQQYKRSALPNGPKVVAGGSLSPRGDWRMPSDARATAWLTDLDRVPDDYAGDSEEAR